MIIKLAETQLSPPVLLAPMAGITDLPYRTLVQRFGAGLVVSEMVSSQEMVQAKPGVRARAELGLDVDGTAIQLAARDPQWIAEAAKMVEGNGAKIIDINMGCPAKKVVNGLSGSALMKDPDHALRLIEAVIEAVNVPVTLKTRLGWDTQMMNAADIAQRAEAAGIQMITIHGRTRCQFYRGKADWKAIRAIKNAVAIPLIANGDITSIEAARQALEQSGADGIMVGRGAQGRPWFLAEIGAALFDSPAPDIPRGNDLAVMVQEHYREILSFYGDKLGARVARKHLGWYMDFAQTMPALRRIILTSTPKEVLHHLPDALNPNPAATEAVAC